MASKWSDIIADPDYISLAEEEKERLKERYFTNVISQDPDFSSALPDQQTQIRQRFFGAPAREVVEERPLRPRISTEEYLERTYPAYEPGLMRPRPELPEAPIPLFQPPEEIEVSPLKRALLAPITPTLEAQQRIISGFRTASETWRRITETVKAPLYEYQKAVAEDRPKLRPVMTTINEAVRGVRFTPGREIVKGMGVPLDDDKWILENPGKHFAAEMLGGWYETYGTDPVILTMWAKSVPYARKANLFNQIIKTSGKKLTPALIERANIPISPRLAKKLSKVMSGGFWNRQAQIAGGLKKISEAELRQALKAVQSVKYIPKPAPPKLIPPPVGIKPKAPPAVIRPTLPPAKVPVRPLVTPAIPPVEVFKPTIPKEIEPFAEKPIKDITVSQFKQIIFGKKPIKGTEGYQKYQNALAEALKENPDAPTEDVLARLQGKYPNLKVQTFYQVAQAKPVVEKPPAVAPEKEYYSPELKRVFTQREVTKAKTALGIEWKVEGKTVTHYPKELFIGKKPIPMAQELYEEGRSAFDLVKPTPPKKEVEVVPERKIKQLAKAERLDELAKIQAKALPSELDKAIRDEASTLLSELRQAEKGRRIAIRDEEGYITGWTAQPSTFPEWYSLIKAKNKEQAINALQNIMKGLDDKVVIERLRIQILERLIHGGTSEVWGEIPPNNTVRRLLGLTPVEGGLEVPTRAEVYGVMPEVIDLTKLGPSGIIKEEVRAYGSKEKANANIYKVADEVESAYRPREPKKIPRIGRKSPIGNILRKTKRVDFRGQKVQTSSDIANLFQVFRNPRIENLHIIYCSKDGTILAHNALSSGDISHVGIPEAETPFKIPDRIRRLNADHVWLLHNHPAGKIDPSKEDLGFAGYLQEDLKGKLRGSIIIDDKKFFALTNIVGTTGTGTKHKFEKAGPDWSGIGQKIKHPGDAAHTLIGLLKNKNAITVAYVDAQNKILGYEVYNKNILKRGTLGQTLSQHKAKHGASGYFIAGDKLVGQERLLRNTVLLVPGHVDIISFDKGKWMSFREMGFMPPKEEVYKEAKYIFEPREEYLAPKAPPERPPLSQPIKLKAVKPSQIARELSERLDVPIKRGKFRKRRAYGIYKRSPQIIRFKAGGIDTISHEIGHHLKTNLPEFDFATDPAKQFSAEIKRLDYDFPKEQRTGEGFSEFVRMYVTDPKAAQKNAPKFHDYFETIMKERYPDIRDTLLVARDEYQAWLALPPEQKIKLQIAFDNPEVISERKVDALYRMFIDELNPITNYVKKAKKLGVKIKPHEDPDTLAHLFAGWTAKADQFLRYGTYHPMTLETTGKSFVEIMKPIEEAKAVDDFSTYLVARRVPELARRGIKTGIETKDAVQTLIKLNRKYPKFQKVAIELTQYQDRLLKYARDSGLISNELMIRVRHLNKNYVPFYRVIEKLQYRVGGGRAFANPPRVVKRIKGSEREIINPIESIIKNTYATINAADRNIVNNAMLNLSKKDKYLGRAFEKVPAPMAKVAKIDIEKELGIEVTDELEQKIVDIFRPSVFTPRDNTVVIFVNGNKQYYELEPTLYRAMTGMDKETTATLIKILSYPARWLRAGAVLTPEFSLARNPLRDQMSAYLYSHYGYKPLYDLLRGMSSLVKKDKYFIMWNRAGGPHASLVSLDRNYMRQTMDELMGMAKWKHFATNPLDGLRALSELSEEATRLGEFKKGTMKGADPFEAAMSSKDVSINFSRKGTVGKSLNMIIAFWNANAQGPNRLWRSFKDYPGRTFWRAIIGITLPSIALWYYNQKHHKERWKEIPQIQKDLFWIIPVSVSTKVAPSGIIMFRFPKPFLPGMLFGSLPERMLDYMQEKDPKALKQLGENTLQGALPGLIPTAMQPIIENQANYSFFRDRPIVPYSKKRVEAEMQYTPYTSEVAKKLGALLNYSPMKIDNMLYGYFAGLGRMAVDGVDKVMKETGMAKVEIDPITFWFEKPMARALIIREPIGSAAESVNELYDYFQRADKEEQSWKKLAREDPEKAREYLDKHPRAVLATHYRRIIRIMGQLRKRRDLVYQNDKLSAVKKRMAIRQIEIQMTKLAQRAIEVEKGIRR